MKQNLDYTNPDAAVNFRDVGEFLNLISGKTILPESRIFRGGTVKAIYASAVIGSPKTIFNLQKGPDHAFPEVRSYHFPISNDYEKYDTSVNEVRDWLRKIIRTVEAGISFPLYVHCLSGRDRTGVVVAALLKICGVADQHIAEEYCLSLGAEGRSHIYLALEGLAKVDDYFKGINLDTVRSIILEGA